MGPVTPHKCDNPEFLLSAWFAYMNTKEAMSGALGHSGNSSLSPLTFLSGAEILHITILSMKSAQVPLYLCKKDLYSQQNLQSVLIVIKRVKTARSEPSMMHEKIWREILHLLQQLDKNTT